MIESSSVDDLARQLCANAMKNTSDAPNESVRWTVLSLFAEGHRRAAALIDAEAAKLTPDGSGKGGRHA